MKEDIGDLGTIGIIREAFKIFRTHAKVFLLIQFTLIIDVVTLGMVAQYFFVPPGAWRGPECILRGSVGEAFYRPMAVINVVAILLVLAVFGLVYYTALSLSLSATVYSVVLHYAGQGVSFVDVIRAAVPRLWMRLAITSSYNLLLHDAFVLVQTVVLVLLAQSGNPGLVMLVGQIFALLSPGWSVGINSIFTVAQGMSVFEEDYGWAAMTKGLKLLKGKVKVAILLQLLMLLPLAVQLGLALEFREELSDGGFQGWNVGIRIATVVVYGWAAMTKGMYVLKGKVKVAILLQLLMVLPLAIQLGLALAFPYELRYGDFPGWNVGIRIARVVVYIVWISFTTQLATLCYGVQYASFNASHKSVSITDSVKPEKVEYERIGNRANEPLLGGQHTDSTV